MQVEPKNKTIMKKFKAIFAAVLLTAALPFAANASDDRPIEVKDLPAAAQQFIRTHFPDAQVSYATVDKELMTKDYKVVFTDGRKVEFSKSGEWTEVEAKHAELPAAIVPQQIRDYIDKHHAGQRVRQIERDRHGYEVKLTNGIELDFNKRFVVVGIDH